LYRYQHCPGDVPDNFQVAYFPSGGAIQVNDVKSRRSLGLPLQGNVQRVIGKNGLLIVVPLVEPYTPAIPKVYGRYYLYFLLLTRIFIEEL